MAMSNPEATEKTRAAISSHNLELDSKLGGGLPIGALTLVEGSSGSGKSVLSQQILWGALQDGLKATLFTSENSISSLVTQMQKLNLDILDHLLLRKLRVYPMALSRLGVRAPAALLTAIRDQSDRTLIVVDSLTSAVIHSTDNAAILRFFEECQRICAKDVTIVVTLHAQGVDEDLLNPLRSMCDADLRLKVEQDGQRMVKTLEVSKVRGADSVTGAVVGFEVEPGWGMRVIPISKARG